MRIQPASGQDVVASIGPDLVVEVRGRVPAAVVDVTHDSRQVSDGWVFACVPGALHDGHEFASEAVSAGAAMLIVDRLLPVGVAGAVAQVVVTDVRRSMALAAAVVHGHPAADLSMVGVTGTNGKTTTTHLIAAILAAAGRRVEVMGTLSGARTTPESTDLQRTLAGFVRNGVDSVVMEVSSHALVLHRVDGVEFDVAVFTNLGSDHLDLHGSMDAYFSAKASLFRPGAARKGVTNLDDVYGRALMDEAKIPMVGYSLDHATRTSIGVDELAFEWQGNDVVVPLGGAFNLANALAALTAADVLGVAVDVAASGISRASAVPGRFESIVAAGTDISVIVDYAHTPDGLEHVLHAARPLATGRLVVVFGCGGDRDREKRPAMGRVAAERADLVVVTSDNPRSESPNAIIDEIMVGIPSEASTRIAVEPDRRDAIERSIVDARSGDVVVIAGKGHETTQVIAGVAHDFDDRAIAREALARRVAGTVNG